jgi:hypothetical protein
MTSSRDSPLSFSPDLRLSLGAPDGLNVALRFAFPCLFNRDYAPTRAVTFVSDDRSGPRLEVRPGALIPAGTLVGLFSGHITRTISIPPATTGSRAWHLAVDGAARPSAVAAALYGHSCAAATVTGSWWCEGQVPCLLAYTARDLRSADRLILDLGACSSGGYTSSQAEAQTWRRATALYAAAATRRGTALRTVLSASRRTSDDSD